MCGHQIHCSLQFPTRCSEVIFHCPLEHFQLHQDCCSSIRNDVVAFTIPTVFGGWMWARAVRYYVEPTPLSQMKPYPSRIEPPACCQRMDFQLSRMWKWIRKLVEVGIWLCHHEQLSRVTRVEVITSLVATWCVPLLGFTKGEYFQVLLQWE
jgi:hypothetical protein